MKTTLGLISFALAVAAGSAHAASQTRTSAFEYDPATGLLVKEIIEPDSPALCLVTTYAYDAYGNKTGATTRNCNGSSSETGAPTGDPLFTPRMSSTAFAAGSIIIAGTTYNWNAGQFPTTNTNATQTQSESKTFDPRFGAVASLTGPNGLTTSWTYDSLGRKASEVRADSTSTTWTYTRCVDSAGTCPTPYGVYFVTVSAWANGTPAVQAAPTVRTFYDSLNREIRSEAQGFDGIWVRKDTQYDSLGRVAQVSRLYKASDSPVWTVYQYDVLNRVVQVDEPTVNGNVLRTVTAYNGLTTTITASNAGGGTNMPGGVTQQKITSKNSQGQVITVTDTQGNPITYTYDAFSNLLTTNAGGVVTTLGYDLRGRKTSMSDPDMGTWLYYYDSLGQIIRQTDAKNQTVSMAYDVLGRMTSRTEPDLVSTWTYDTCTTGIGKLCAAAATNGYERTHSYDSRGRLSSLSITIDATYSISTSYDGAGRVDTLTYPNGYAVQNVYNTYGYLWKVQRSGDPDTTVYWTANGQNAAGQVTAELLGNGLTTSRTYDALFRLTAVSSSATGGTVHSLTYGYDTLGNVTQRQDLTQSVTENFAYDTLNRLLSASGTGLTTRSFNYDTTGNITYKSDVGAYTYPGTGQRHAVSNVTGSGAANTVTASYTYDANGNLTAASGTVYPNSGSATFSRSLTPTSYNMPSTLTHMQDGSTYSNAYTYNSEHERVKLITTRPDDTLTNVYVHPNGNGALLYEKEIRQSDGRIEHRYYVNGGSGVVGVFVTKTIYATGEGPEMRYYHRDHLGSVATITNPGAAVIERLAYEAFGERRAPNGAAENRTSPLISVTTDRGFTAHEHLDEMMLIHMNGRIYDPVIARFMTSDPFVAGDANLQAYNRYSYVKNNPLAFTDPSGYFSLKKAIGATVKAVFLPTPKNIFNAVHEQPFQAQIDRFVLSNKLAYMGGQWAATYFTAFCGGCGGAIWSSYYTYEATGSMSRAARSGAITYASHEMGETINSYYGSAYSGERVFVEASGDGLRSVATGGKFEDGFKRGFAMSGLAYLNVQSRDVMKEQSRLDLAAGNDSGASVGLFGDRFKLGGARMIEDGSGALSTPQGFLATFFGGVQGDEGTFAGFAYGVGSLPDRVVEAFAGPHDFFNNLTGSYTASGNAVDISGFSGLRAAASNISNAAGVLVVAPVAMSGFIRSENVLLQRPPRR